MTLVSVSPRLRSSTTRGTQSAAAGTSIISTVSPSSQRRVRPRAVTTARPAIEVTTTVTGTAMTTRTTELRNSWASGMKADTEA